ncbi:putative pck1-phosphoenolpyruvate carboxykinase [Fusarium flagelliforme]|uniref:Putative pck1-phosphoenolpyruvate carboxykinase n=1 Tax=Fusarium flagelliforme TaxID=2675880 RepID=A0A395MA54_9HYPO|nr:putative pck1-phosphoenolpyruvate carboxykinase [Fusarium flagelliforme]
MDGYVLAHTIVLAHCRVPEPADQPHVRTLILALEAAFATIFWTMRSSTTPPGYGSLRDNAIWPLDDLPWGGLCTHNPLTEGVKGLELSAEEFTAVAEQRRLRKNDELSPTSRVCFYRQRPPRCNGPR